MKRATITLTDELEKELDRYLKRQPAPPSLTAILQAALRFYLREQLQLDERQYQPPKNAFKLTPAKTGSGVTDTSAHHDDYL